MPLVTTANILQHQALVLDVHLHLSHASCRLSSSGHHTCCHKPASQILPPLPPNDRHQQHVTNEPANGVSCRAWHTAECTTPPMQPLYRRLASRRPPLACTPSSTHNPHALTSSVVVLYVMYLSACSCSSRAELLASWNSPSLSSRSPLLMPSRPLVAASTALGVSSCTAWRRLVRSPISPR